MCLFLMFHYISISQIQNAPVGSPQRQEAQKNLHEEINHRKQIDQNIIEILRLSLKQSNVLDLLTSTRTGGQTLVDDWDCFKNLVTTPSQSLLFVFHVKTLKTKYIWHKTLQVRSFKNQCEAKTEYDIKYTGALANICNMGVDVKQAVSAIEQACVH